MCSGPKHAKRLVGTVMRKSTGQAAKGGILKFKQPHTGPPFTTIVTVNVQDSGAYPDGVAYVDLEPADYKSRYRADGAGYDVTPFPLEIENRVGICNVTLWVHDS